MECVCVYLLEVGPDEKLGLLTLLAGFATTAAASPTPADAAPKLLGSTTPADAVTDSAAFAETLILAEM